MRNNKLNRNGTPAFVLALLLPMALLVTNAQGQTLDRIRAAGTINLGYAPEQAPFSSTGADGKPSGYGVELCQWVADSLRSSLQLPDLKANFVSAKPADSIKMVAGGQIDLYCGAVGETLESRKQASFSIPVYLTGIGVLVRKDAPPAVLRVLNGEAANSGPKWRGAVNAGLANQTFAVDAGTASEAFVRRVLAQLDVLVKVVPVDSYEAGAALVEQGKAAAFFGNRTKLVIYAAGSKSSDATRVLDRHFTAEPVAFPLQRGDEDFRLAVDAALSKMLRSDAFYDLYKRSFGKPSETARLLSQAYSLP